MAVDAQEGPVTSVSPALTTPGPRGTVRVPSPDPATAEFPLALISPASERSINSTLAELPRPDVRLLMHPGDAQERAT